MLWRSGTWVFRGVVVSRRCHNNEGSDEFLLFSTQAEEFLRNRAMRMIEHARLRHSRWVASRKREPIPHTQPRTPYCTKWQYVNNEMASVRCTTRMRTPWLTATVADANRVAGLSQWATVWCDFCVYMAYFCAKKRIQKEVEVLKSFTTTHIFSPTWTRS